MAPKRKSTRSTSNNPAPPTSKGKVVKPKSAAKSPAFNKMSNDDIKAVAAEVVKQMRDANLVLPNDSTSANMDNTGSTDQDQPLTANPLPADPSMPNNSATREITVSFRARSEVDFPQRRPKPTTSQSGQSAVDFQSSPPTNSSQDLTDQPNLKVKLPSRSERHNLYAAHRYEAYPMSKKPRGSVCIINVKKIDGFHESRCGTDVDRNKLERLFKTLHYEVVVYNDDDGLQAEAIRVKLRTFAALPSHDQAQCAVICLLSHGGDGYILGTDAKEVSTTDISDYFNNANCPALMCKPKLFFFQACRGGTKDVGVCKDDATQPTRGDMFFGFPTTTGYVALRDPKNGSWYMSALVKVFAKRAWNTELSDMMIEIRNLLAKNALEGHKQCSEDRSTLKKKFYFFMAFSQLRSRSEPEVPSFINHPMFCV